MVRLPRHMATARPTCWPASNAMPPIQPGPTTPRENDASREVVPGSLAFVGSVPGLLLPRWLRLLFRLPLLLVLVLRPGDGVAHCLLSVGCIPPAQEPGQLAHVRPRSQSQQAHRESRHVAFLVP